MHLLKCCAACVLQFSRAVALAVYGRSTAVVSGSTSIVLVYLTSVAQHKLHVTSFTFRDTYATASFPVHMIQCNLYTLYAHCTATHNRGLAPRCAREMIFGVGINQVQRNCHINDCNLNTAGNSCVWLNVV
jgi:hypothetical protein